MSLSVPKQEVHKKVGFSLNAKGLVGITTAKNYLSGSFFA
jgi:hypothetical protein